jgi:hypothetical protein
MTRRWRFGALHLIENSEGNVTYNKLKDSLK